MVCQGSEKRSDLGSIFKAMAVDTTGEIIYITGEEKENQG